MSSVKGAVIDGYVVGDVLGSGASGLLYEAVHEDSGRQAIVRVAGADGDDARLVEVFAQEAAGLLVGEGRPVVRRTQSADGRTLLLLEKVARGGGHTEHSVTERLPRIASGARPAELPPSRRAFAMVVGAALVLGVAGAGAVTWALTSAAGPVQSPPSPAPATTSKPAADVERAPAPEAVLPPPAPAAAPPASAPKATRAASPVSATKAPPPGCQNLDKWKADMRHELSALETYVARDEALADDFERHQSGFDYLHVTDAAGCARVEKNVDAFCAAHGLSR